MCCSVFVHRYRDRDPHIRVDCLDALGQWIKALPDVYLDSQYLRYLGWMLSDKVHREIGFFIVITYT